MAYIKKTTNKKGEVRYIIKVSCGYDLNDNQITHTMTYVPTATTPKKMEKEATAFGCNVMSDLLNQQRNKCEKPA